MIVTQTRVFSADNIDQLTQEINLFTQLKPANIIIHESEYENKVYAVVQMTLSESKHQLSRLPDHTSMSTGSSKSHR